MKKIEHIEHKFNIFLPENQLRPDVHIVKELITYCDGSKERSLRIIKNFKRPFYITKKHFRNHKQKKEYELLSKVNTYYSTQSQLPNEIARRLEMPGYKRNQYRDVLKSPYLYGSDIPSTAILSKFYENKYGLKFTPYKVATLDIESDVDSRVITVITSIQDKTIRTTINRYLLRNLNLTSDDDIKQKIYKLFKENIDEKYKDYTLDITIHDNEVEIIKAIFDFIHKGKPDFLAIWNVLFDIKMIENVLRKNNIDPKMIFSDPDIPHEIKHYEFREGPKKKKKADGTVMQIDVQNRWHVIKTSSSFFIIDAMCAYAAIRTGASKLVGGYGIDNVAKKELGDTSGKLKFKDLLPDNLSKEDWHRRMSREFPLEYIVYNMADNTLMIDLNDKTNDLTVVLPTLAGNSSLEYFNSGPSKIVDKLYHEILEDGMVLGTKPFKEENNKHLGLDGWIVTLEASRITRSNIDVIKRRKQ